MSLPDTGPQQGALISLPEAAPSESKSEFKPAQEDRKRTSAASNINRPAKKASQDRPTDASTSSCCGGAAAQPSDNRKAQASREAPSERQDSSSPVPPMVRATPDPQTQDVTAALIGHEKEDDSGITPSSSPIAAIKNALSEHQLPLALAEHLVKVGQNGRACFFEVATQRNAVANVARLSSGGQFVQSDRSSWEGLQRVMRDADTLEDHELIATLNQIYRKYQGPGMGAILLRRYAQLYISRAFDRTRPADAPENVNWRHPRALRLLQVARIGVQTAQHHRSAGHRLQNLTQGRDGILALLPIARESRWTDPVTGRVVTSSDAVQRFRSRMRPPLGPCSKARLSPSGLPLARIFYTILAGRPPSSRLVRASSIHTALPVIRDSAESTAKGS